MPTVFPLASRRVDDAKQLVVGDRLRVEVDSHGFLLHDLVGLEQRLPDHALTRPSVTNDEHGVSDVEEFLQLHHLQQTTNSQPGSSTELLPGVHTAIP